MGFIARGASLLVETNDQWQPTLAEHDPNPPLTLESPGDPRAWTAAQITRSIAQGHAGMVSGMVGDFTRTPGGGFQPAWAAVVNTVMAPGAMA